MKALIKRAIASGITGLSRAAVNGPGPIRAAAAYAFEQRDERRQLVTPQGSFTLRTANPIERWRADSLLTKEPETIEWLVRTFQPGSVLFDIGANVGLYTLFAAMLTRDQADGGGASARVVCFEPEPLNLARLNLNIADNGFSQRVTAYCLALGVGDGVGTFPLSSLTAGAAMHGDRYINADSAPHVVGSVGMSLDDFVARAGYADDALPTHLKIDVDGPEIAILKGAAKTLRHDRLRHVLIELHDDERADGERLLTAAGFRQTGSGDAFRGMANMIFAKP